MKICIVCSKSKDFDSFYLSWNWSKTKKIRVNSCKECTNIASKKHYRKNNTKYKKATAKWNKEHPESRLKTYRKYRENNREKFRARDRLDYAVNKGHILKKPCIVCGSIKSEGHHEDYTKPLEVIWLCSKHHAEKHNKENMGVEATIV